MFVRRPRERTAFRLRLEVRGAVGLLLRAVPDTGATGCPRCGRSFALHALVSVGRRLALMGARRDADPYPCLVFSDRRRRAGRSASRVRVTRSE